MFKVDSNKNEASPTYHDKHQILQASKSLLVSSILMKFIIEFGKKLASFSVTVNILERGKVEKRDGTYDLVSTWYHFTGDIVNMREEKPCQCTMTVFVYTLC